MKTTNLLLVTGFLLTLAGQASATSLTAENSSGYSESGGDTKQFNHPSNSYYSSNDDKLPKDYQSSYDDKSSHEYKPSYDDKSSHDYKPSDDDKSNHDGKPYPGHYYPPKNVPEPSSLMMLGLGFLAVGWLIRRKAALISRP